MLIRRILTASLVCASLGACVTHINTTTLTNPPPREKFADFSAFELQPLQVAAEYQGKETAAVARIQEHLDLMVLPVLQHWSQPAAAGRTLVVSPKIEAIKFVGGGARFFVGALAGSSAVIMKVRYTDKATGDVIAEPQFFQRAAAMSGAWTIGAQDNNMLKRIVGVMSNYTQRNYEAAVGGPTGADPE